MLLRTNAWATHILTYAAPSTRKMLHFGDLKYYAIPSLPNNWHAPMWLRIELGIYAGRLYFDFTEYDDILRYLGVMDTASAEEERVDGLGYQNHGAGDESEEKVGFYCNLKESTTQVEGMTDVSKTFTRKPFSFLQEWLDIRRKGQDFAHTPMGHICQGKPLLASHPFFTKPDEEGAERPVHMPKIQEGASEELNVENDVGDYYDAEEFGLDDAGDEGDLCADGDRTSCV